MAKVRELAPAVTLSHSMQLLLASPHHLFFLQRGLQKTGKVVGKSFHAVLGAYAFVCIYELIRTVVHVVPQLRHSNRRLMTPTPGRQIVFWRKTATGNVGLIKHVAAQNEIKLNEWAVMACKGSVKQSFSNRKPWLGSRNIVSRVNQK